MSNTDALRARLNALPAPHPAEALTLRPGGPRDYAALSEHHYRASKPATATRVLVLEDGRATAADRYLDRPATPGVVAVMVESLPTLSCRSRDWALRGRYGRWLPAKQRAALLNHELRCISRVVVHPSWRGLGLAVRLVRAALAAPTTRFTEALAAMGAVSPFFEKAGMTAYPRPPHAFDQRLLAALQHHHFTRDDLARPAQLATRIDTLNESSRAWLLNELRRWAGRNGHRDTRDSGTTDLLSLAQQRLLLEPVYYLHDRDSEARGRRPWASQGLAPKLQETPRRTAWAKRDSTIHIECEGT